MSSAPQNTNYLQPTKFQLTFPRISDAVYFCQEVIVPGVSMGSALQPTPNLDLFVPGTKLRYNDFSMTFVVNEDLSSWLLIYKWMRGLTTQTEESWFKKQDAILTVLSSLNNPKLRFKLYDIFPLSLSDIQLDTKKSADEILTATVNFKYNYFEVEKL